MNIAMIKWNKKILIY